MLEATRETLSAWFLIMAISLYRIMTGNRRGLLNNMGPVSPRRPLLEHTYMAGMIMAGLITWPVRRIQHWLGRGDELLVIARATT